MEDRVCHSGLVFLQITQAFRYFFIFLTKRSVYLAKSICYSGV